MNSRFLVVPNNAVLLRSSATDNDILSLVKRWVDALAREDYGSAYNMTAHEPYYEWTPQLIREVIEGYGLPDPHPDGPFKVTPLKSAKGDLAPRHEVDRFDSPYASGAIGEVWFDLPLNDEWSDLTATFAIYRLDSNIVIALNEIHVF